MYAKIPFRLMNVGYAFQRAMYIVFLQEKDIIVFIYQDDIKLYSKYDQENLNHLHQVFPKCREFKISLNPKKSFFSMTEGKLLSHIISREGIKIDPSRVVSIQKVDFPISKKMVQSFLGKANFLRRFITNFSKIMKFTTNMLRKDNDIKWTAQARKYFVDIKKSLTQSLILIILYFTKDFLIFSFSSKHTIGGLLLHKYKVKY